MKNPLIAMCGALVMAAAASAAAQTPEQRPTTSTASSAESVKSVTISGCLKPADPASLSAPSARTTESPALGGPNVMTTDYRLEKAEMKGAPAAGSTASTHDAYVVRAESASVNLAAHLNHTIEVTGVVAPTTTDPKAGTLGATPASPETTTTPPPPAGRPAEGATMPDRSMAHGMSTPVVTVTAVKMISATCDTRQ